MRAAYAVHEATPPEMLPRWKPFAPLPVGPVYPPFDGFPAAVINYAQKEVARIRAYENELIVEAPRRPRTGKGERGARCRPR